MNSPELQPEVPSPSSETTAPRLSAGGHAQGGAAEAEFLQANGSEEYQEPSIVARVACFSFTVALLVALAMVGTFLHSERSALRRADADVIGMLTERSAESITVRMDDRDGRLDRAAFSMLQDEVARLAEARGVRQVALLLEGGDEIITAQSQEVTRASGGASLPMPNVSGPGRTLSKDHLIIARSFRLRATDTDESMLVVKADFPSLDSRMRDLVALSGRAIGLAALFLVFLTPVFARFLARSHVRAAKLVREGLTPAPEAARGGGAELVELVERIADDDARIEKAERDRVEITEAARDRLRAMREELQRSRHAAEEAQKEARSATAAKAAFVANTSHEVRTPLHAVLGTTSLMLETNLDAEQRALADRSMRASKLLLSLVDDVLDLARFDAREIRLAAEPFDPGALVEDVAELSGALAASKGLEIGAFVSPECPAVLIGDAMRIRQALMRLVDNAIKFADSGEISIEVTWEAYEDGVPRAVFSVTDTGIGIGEEERARLFSAFEQVDGSNTRRHGGVGLGLALVARIARACSGEVRLDSRRGRGSRFSLVLPLGLDPTESKGIAKRVTERRVPLHGLSVLVLDDAPATARLFGRTLEILGAHARVESSTYAGFEAFVRERFDLVFLGAKLAGRDAFLGALESSEHQAPVPVILMTPPMTGSVQGETQDKAVSALVAKPLSRRAVESVVRRVLTGETAPEPGADLERSRTKDRRSLLESQMRRRIRILLVEDNQTNQQLVQYVLGKRGYQVDVASNGRRAVDAFAMGDYDAILMDCQMPEMDGYEATRRIRSLEEPRGSHTPVLAMTASVLDSDRDKCLEAGMDDMLSKPFQPHRMVEWLEGWLLRTLSGDESRPGQRITRAEALAELKGQSRGERAAGMGAPVTSASPHQAGPREGLSGLVSVPAAEQAQRVDPGAERIPRAAAPSSAQGQGEGAGQDARSAPRSVPLRQGEAARASDEARAEASAQAANPAAPLPQGKGDGLRMVPRQASGAALSGIGVPGSLSPGARHGAFDKAEVAHAVDTDVLGSLMDDEEGRILASELIDSFLAVAPARLEDLERAIETSDLAACASIAHELVSTSGTVGAVRLARMLRDVSRFASHGNPSDSARLVAGCKAEVEMARLALVRAIGR